MASIIGEKFTVKVTRPIGSTYPSNEDIKYNINYGNAQKRKSTHQIRYNVIQKDNDGNVIKIWKCASEVAETLKLNKGTIMKSCQKGLKNYGYFWEYKKC